MVGQSLSHYQITSELGRAGMGIVYKGEDTKLHRTVAIKVLPAAALSSEEDRARFYCEARAAASLDGSNSSAIQRDVGPGSAWSSDGRNIYFIRAGNLFRLRVESGSEFRTIGMAVQLTTDGLVEGFSLDPTSDRILLLTNDRPPLDYVVIEWWQNWAQSLQDE
jgi:serine/threonine protein kinase